MMKWLIAAIVALWLSPCLAFQPQVAAKNLPGVVAYLIDDGDSFFTTAGTAATGGQTILGYVIVPGKSPYLGKYIVAKDGQTMATVLANFTTNITPLYNQATTLYGSSYQFVVQLLAGANDIRAGTAASVIYANMQSYVNAVHALGSNAKVTVGSYPLQCDVFQNSTWLASLQTLNGLIIAGATTAQGSGGLGADGLANFFADPTVGMNTYSSSAFCGSPNQYSPDGQHGTALSKSIFAPVESAAVTPLMP